MNSLCSVRFSSGIQHRPRVSIVRTYHGAALVRVHYYRRDSASYKAQCDFCLYLLIETASLSCIHAQCLDLDTEARFTLTISRLSSLNHTKATTLRPIDECREPAHDASSMNLAAGGGFVALLSTALSAQTRCHWVLTFLCLNTQQNPCIFCSILVISIAC